MLILSMVEWLCLVGILFDMYYCVCLIDCMVFVEWINVVGFCDCVCFYVDDGDFV